MLANPSDATVNGVGIGGESTRLTVLPGDSGSGKRAVAAEASFGRAWNSRKS